MEAISSDLSDFASRSQSVFDSLLSLEHNHKVKEIEYVKQTEQILIEKDFELERHFQYDNNSEFKVPCIDSYKRQLENAPPSLSKHQKKAPDHIVNPNKWTKYSLEDVDASQMSNSANLNAAMSFLNKNKETSTSLEQSLDEIVYNKPIGENRMETNRNAYSHVEKHLLEKLNEENEVEDDLEKIDQDEMDTDQILFKKKSKSKNLRNNRKSTEDDLEYNNHLFSNQSENLNQNQEKDDDDDAIDKLNANQDSNYEENEFGDDFEKF